MRSSGLFVDEDYSTADRFAVVAAEGAQVRRLTALCAPSGAANACEFWTEMRPRSIVIIARDELVRRSAELAVALASPVNIPITITAELPNFTGALDLVVALDDEDGQLSALEAITVAHRRGARTIILAGGEGPLRDEAPEDSVVVDKPAGIVAGNSPLRSVIGCFSIIWLATGDAANAARVRDWLGALANLIDDDLETLAPRNSGVTNPATALRAFIAKDPVIHTAHDGLRAGEKWGLHCSALIATLWLRHGLPATACAITDALAVADAGTSSTDDLFHDPYLDGPNAETISWRTIVWASDETGIVGSQRVIAQNTEPLTSPVAELKNAPGAVKAARLITRAYATTAHSDAPDDPEDSEVPVDPVEW